jgi:hypothetical protein
MAMNPHIRQTLVDLYGEENVAALEAAQPEDAPINDNDLVREIDEGEAERFRLELERDERCNPDDW